MKPDTAVAHKDSFLRRFQLKSLVASGTTVVVMFLVPLPISLSTPWSYWRTFNVVAAAFVTFIVLTIFIQLLFIKPRAGQVLLDAGPYPKRGLFLLSASVWLAIAVLSLSFGQGVRVFVQSQPSSLPLAAFYTLLSFGRLHVCSKGIWLYYNLLPWHKLKAYRWQNGTLYLETKGMYFWTQTSCTMPEKHVEAFEAYLLERGISDHTADSLATA